MTGTGGKVVAAFDKFRGTATAGQLGEAARRSAERAGWASAVVPMADGGEGSLSAVGGANKHTLVTGPLGAPVEAGWRLDHRVAFIEMASASGLLLAGGPEGNDPIAADTTGTGELIATAVKLGARTVYVFLGGSATTDGGWGAIQALPPAPRLKEIDLVVAVDVQTRFTEAAAVFGPQKGASGAQVALLERRLQRLVQVYQESYGVDVGGLGGAGAAGGLAGGLAAVGGRIESGFDVIAEWAELDTEIAAADLVVTGEGYLDAESFNGKVVGGVVSWATEQSVPVLAVVGDADGELTLPPGLDVVSLADQFGIERAMTEPTDLVEQVIGSWLSNATAGRRHGTR